MDTLYNIKGNRRKRLASSHFVFSSTWTGGRSEVRWRPGARSRFGAPMVKPEVFRKQIYCDEESTCDIVGTFRRPQ